MAKKLQLMPLPDIGETITVTTKDCDLDSIILDISQRGVVKYFAAIRVNDDTIFKLPSGVYRFSFHYSKTSGPAAFGSSVKTLVPPSAISLTAS